MCFRLFRESFNHVCYFPVFTSHFSSTIIRNVNIINSSWLNSLVLSMCLCRNLHEKLKGKANKTKRRGYIIIMYVFYTCTTVCAMLTEKQKSDRMHLNSHTFLKVQKSKRIRVCVNRPLYSYIINNSCYQSLFFFNDIRRLIESRAGLEKSTELYCP